MSETRDRVNGGSEALLHAYHDGELTGLARWRFERELRRSPALKEELAELSELGEALRDRDAAEPSPDLWGAISARLPAVDARRLEDLIETPSPSFGERLTPWLKPIGAVAATAAVALVVVYSGFWRETPKAAGGVVRWIDSGERSVMVLDDDPNTTIIWVLDGAAEGAWIGGGREEAV